MLRMHTGMVVARYVKQTQPIRCSGS
jgi:hypothetical protein